MEFLCSQILENLLAYASNNYVVIHLPKSGDMYDMASGRFYEVKTSRNTCPKNPVIRANTAGPYNQRPDTNLRLSECLYYRRRDKFGADSYTFRYGRRQVNHNRNYASAQRDVRAHVIGAPNFPNQQGVLKGIDLNVDIMAYILANIVSGAEDVESNKLRQQGKNIMKIRDLRKFVTGKAKSILEMCW